TALVVLRILFPLQESLSYVFSFVGVAVDICYRPSSCSCKLESVVAEKELSKPGNRAQLSCRERLSMRYNSTRVLINYLHQLCSIRTAVDAEVSSVDRRKSVGKIVRFVPEWSSCQQGLALITTSSIARTQCSKPTQPDDNQQT
ncbi:hypothetical protein COCMIDRAFT_89908, partial [Bipolaris oryzae ATCC 44560]